jgi:hypothetical protein
MPTIDCMSCSCLERNYSNVMQGSSGPTGSSSTTSIPHSQSSSAISHSSVGQSSVGQSTGLSTYTTTDTSTAALHSQSPYPSIAASSCGSWTLVDNVCCPSYCATDDTSESCTCSSCTTPPSADCKSGTMYPEVHTVSTNETWHYSVRLLNPMQIAMSRYADFWVYHLRDPLISG